MAVMQGDERRNAKKLRQRTANLEAGEVKHTQTKAELRETAEKYRLFIKNAHEGAWAIDAEAVTTFVNPRMAEILGYSAEELLGKHLLSFMDERGVKIATHYLERLQKGVSGRHDFEFKRKDGTIVSTSLSASPLINDKGEYQGAIATVEDITERRCAEEALRQSEEYSSTILNHSPNPIFVANPDTSIRYVNPAFEVLTGYSLIELIGQKAPYPWWPEETSGKLKQDFEAAFRHGDKAKEQLFQKKRGKRFWVEITSTPVTANGEFKYYLSNWVDITERKHAEEALQLRAHLLNEATDSIVATDLDGNLIYMNEATCRTRGYSKEEMLTMNLKQLVPREKASLIDERIRRVQKEGAIIFESEHLRKDGSVFLAEILARTINLGGRRIILSVIRDVTERKQTEDRIRRAAEEWRTTFDTISDCVLTADKDCLILRVNKAFADHFEIKPQQAIGRLCYELICGAKKPLPDCPHLQAIKTKRPALRESYNAPLGLYFDTLCSPVINAAGKVTAVVHVMRDITERKKAEEDIRKFKIIADNAGYGVSIGDMEGRLVYANEAYARMHGYTVEELIGSNLFKLYPEDQKEFMKKRGERIMKTGSNAGELIRLKKDGTTFPTLSVATLVKDDEERPLYIASSHFDLTERKQAEEALRISEERFSKAFHSNPRPMSIVTLEEGRYLDVNNSYVQTFGFSRKELRGRTTLELGITKTGRTRRKILQLLKKTKAVKNLEVELYTKSGRKVDALLSTDKIEIGGETCLLTVINDVTERKKAEEALRESEERYRALLELGERIGEAVVMLQDDERGVGMHVYASDEWSRITGYSRKKLLNMSMADLIHPSDREEAMKRHARRIRGEVLPGFYELTIIRKDGTEVPAEVTYAYSSYKGKPVNVGYIREITERKKMEQQLIVTDRLASIGELAAGVAHELNNPLTGIIGFSELLLKKDTPKDIKEDLSIINREAQRTAQVVRNLLTFARRHETTKKPADINQAIQSVLDLRAYEQKVHNIEVVTNFDPALPELTADIFRLQQVFLNIIINAEHFMSQEHGRGTLTITTERRGDVIRISFADDGPGIDKEHLRHVFDPFFTTKEVGKGTGLGLSICHGIVAEHGGHIFAESAPNKGATFIAELPVK